MKFHSKWTTPVIRDKIQYLTFRRMYMAQVIMIPAISQPTGEFRLLDWLQTNLNDPEFANLKFAVAFAKVNPLYKLDPFIQEWKRQGKTIEAIIGIDHKGTSVQALDYMLNVFDSTYLLHASHSTFHPKMYLFYGETRASFFIGSNNLTPGGLETNFECGVLLNLSIDEDRDLFLQGMQGFELLLPSSLDCCIPLSGELLSMLSAHGLLLDESVRHRRIGTTTDTTETGRNNDALVNETFGRFRTRPPRAIPRSVIERLRLNRNQTVNATDVTIGGEAEGVLNANQATIPMPEPITTNGLVIQIIPHHNGEILLSKRAVDQNPAFFGFPFTGHTIPKFAHNASYPQRTPDPIVNMSVYDNTGTIVRNEIGYSLNTVFYAAKSEIRITISPEILSSVPEYSILVMTIPENTEYDYDLMFFAPGSQLYTDYLSVCDQTLPSGGNPIARKMGWL